MPAVIEQLSDPVYSSSVCLCEEKIRIWRKKKRNLKENQCQFQSVAARQYFFSPFSCPAFSLSNWLRCFLHLFIGSYAFFYLLWYSHSSLCRISYFLSLSESQFAEIIGFSCDFQKHSDTSFQMDLEPKSYYQSLSLRVLKCISNFWKWNLNS